MVLRKSLNYHSTFAKNILRSLLDKPIVFFVYYFYQYLKFR